MGTIQIAAALFSLDLIQLMGPGGQRIEVNPHAIVDFRPPRSTDHFAPGTKCLVFLSDGKFISITESCEEIKQRLGKM